MGKDGSRPRSVASSAPAISPGSRSDRAISMIPVEGCWRMGRNMADAGVSVSTWYLPSCTTPTTWTRIPLGILKSLPMAFWTDPKILRANSSLTTATLGDWAASCHVKARPARRTVPAASKYSGETVYCQASPAALLVAKDIGVAVASELQGKVLGIRGGSDAGDGGDRIVHAPLHDCGPIVGVSSHVEIGTGQDGVTRFKTEVGMQGAEEAAHRDERGGDEDGADGDLSGEQEIALGEAA